jgi:hypothetical protein
LSGGFRSPNRLSVVCSERAARLVDCFDTRPFGIGDHGGRRSGSLECLAGQLVTDQAGEVDKNLVSLAVRCEGSIQGSNSFFCVAIGRRRPAHANYILWLLSRAIGKGSQSIDTHVSRVHSHRPNARLIATFQQRRGTQFRALTYAVQCTA